MVFISTNPFDLSTVGEHEVLTRAALAEKLTSADAAFAAWRSVSLEVRCELLTSLSNVLLRDVEQHARIITREMGKPIRESRAEIEKCAQACRYYAEQATAVLQPVTLASDATRSYVRHDPLGVVFAIMPWNFPFWQVIRFAAPNLAAGNAVVLKHAPNVFGCAAALEQAFLSAGFPDGVFQSLVVDHTSAEEVISHPSVRGVTLTGSGTAGAAVAALAGKYLKKSVLELGGSNAFVVWNDADVEEAATLAAHSRFGNAGQSCIAAKRLIVEQSVADRFVEALVARVDALVPGDPLAESTTIGPMARVDLAENLERQVRESCLKGAVVLRGGHRRNAWFEPTVLTNVQPGMAAFEEETFGPLACISVAENNAAAMELAMQTRYGLGITVCTTSVAAAEAYAARVSDGAFFVNQFVKSDPRLPFGGTGISGYGRELSSQGLLEFTNTKTVYIR